MLDFVFRMFSLGDIAVPARWMEALAQQLAGGLPPGTIRTQTRVKGLQDGTFVLDSNEQLRSRAVVIATDGASAAQLLGERHPPPYITSHLPVFCRSAGPAQRTGSRP